MHEELKQRRGRNLPERFRRRPGPHDPSFAAALLHEASGGVALIAALTLPFLIAIVALVAEYCYGLHCKRTDRRVTALAAYAGASAYGATASTATMNAV